MSAIITDKARSLFKLYIEKREAHQLEMRKLEAQLMTITHLMGWTREEANEIAGVKLFEETQQE